MAIKDTQTADFTRRIKEQQEIIETNRSANTRVYEKYESTGKMLGDFNA
jgi:hypothetical protein